MSSIKQNFRIRKFVSKTNNFDEKSNIPFYDTSIQKIFLTQCLSKHQIVLKISRIKLTKKLKFKDLEPIYILMELKLLKNVIG